MKHIYQDPPYITAAAFVATVVWVVLCIALLPIAAVLMWLGGIGHGITNLLGLPLGEEK